MSKVLFVVAKEGFKDIEFLNPSNIIRSAGYEIFIASNTKAGDIVRGAGGMEIKNDYALNEVAPEDFDMIVFVGGPGALNNLENDDSFKIIKRMVELNKPLAAICISPVILAKAGVLAGKKATVWSSESDKEPIGILEEKGAEYKNEPVVVDRKIITANGPKASEEFGKKLLEFL